MKFVPVQIAALQNLVKIMGLYYHFMEAYMGPALFAVSSIPVIIRREGLVDLGEAPGNLELCFLWNV